ncbi:MAG: folylpolyglutamate synthase/dihydrofolate synthase family protein [Isosphaeraceae bacterium]
MTDLYHDCLGYLYGRLNYERLGMPRSSELRVGRMRRLLRALGDPQDALRIVHVAGTKGKGSTSAMIAATLTASGLRTGLFCSPHLHSVEERFAIDGLAITAEEFVELVEAVRPVVTAFDAGAAADALRGPTFFEVTTAMGMLHFARRKTDAVVLEVGLGGRLDSTNAIRPVVSVITNISFDHTKQLGNTLAAIAREKAGIIKRGRPVVSGERQSEPREVIRAVARQRRSRYREIGSDFEFDYQPPHQPLERPTPGTVTTRLWNGSSVTGDLPLLGRHQAENAAVAAATIEVLREEGLDIAQDALSRGFAGLAFPARVEIMGENPWLVVDGAHNVASALALEETLRTCLPAVPRTLVFGTTRDKDLLGQLRVLLPGSSQVVATRYVENPRAVPPEDVAAAVQSLAGPNVVIAADPREAIETARRLTPSHGLICVTGSLFLAAETRAVLLGMAPVVRAGHSLT